MRAVTTSSTSSQRLVPAAKHGAVVVSPRMQHRRRRFIVSSKIRAICPYSLPWNQRGRLVHLDPDNEPAPLLPFREHPLGFPMKPPSRVRFNANRGEVMP